MKTVCNIFSHIVLAGLLLCVPAAHAEEYATKRLARIARTLRKQAPPYDVAMRVNAYNEVEHIGLRLFPDAMRAMVPSPTYDFLERFLLEVNITQGVERERLLLESGIIFMVGSADTALKIDTTYSYGEEKIAYHRYRSTWSKGGKEVLKVVFSMNWQTLSGCNIDELEDNFKKRLLRHKTVRFAMIPEKDSYIISPVFRNSLYLDDTGGQNGTRGYIFTPEQMSRSVSNLMLADDIAADVTLILKVNRYDYITDTLTIALKKYLNFCRAEEGCTPYFALKGRKGKSVEGVLICANSSGGFLHMLSVSVDESVIETGKGTVSGTLLPYIPLHNVKKEYLNLTEYETVE